MEGTDFTVSQYLSQKSVGIYVRGGSWGQVKACEAVLRAELESLQDDRTTIDAVSGSEHDDEDPSGAYRDYWGGCYLDINSGDQTNWQRMTEWLYEKLCLYRRVLSECKAD